MSPFTRRKTFLVEASDLARVVTASKTSNVILSSGIWVPNRDFRRVADSRNLLARLRADVFTLSQKVVLVPNLAGDCSRVNTELSSSSTGSGIACSCELSISRNTDVQEPDRVAV